MGHNKLILCGIELHIDGVLWSDVDLPVWAWYPSYRINCFQHVFGSGILSGGRPWSFRVVGVPHQKLVIVYYHRRLACSVTGGIGIAEYKRLNDNLGVTRGVFPCASIGVRKVRSIDILGSGYLRDGLRQIRRGVIGRAKKHVVKTFVIHNT